MLCIYDHLTKISRDPMHHYHHYSKLIPTKLNVQTYLVGGWATPVKNVSQLGLLFQKKSVPNHQPAMHHLVSPIVTYRPFVDMKPPHLAEREDHGLCLRFHGMMRDGPHVLSLSEVGSERINRCTMYIIEGSLEAKLPTIWRDGNGTARKKLGRGESQKGR